jgi:hypothetical protein
MSIHAYGPNDVVVHFTLSDESTIEVPLRRFSAIADSTGNIDGVFEVSSIVTGNIGENLIEIIDEPKITISITQRDEPIILFSYPNCTLHKEHLNIPKFNSGIMETTYNFSNRSDWQDHLVELPPEPLPNLIDYRDALFRIARGIEKLAKPDDNEVVMSIEEYREFLKCKDIKKKYILEE